MTTKEGDLRPPGFGVYIDQPYQIWQDVRDDLLSRGNYRNISQLMKDPNRSDAVYTVSETIFGSAAPLFTSEITQLEIQVEGWGPYCEISSTLSLDDQTKKNPFLDYYSDSRLIDLESILKNAGFNARVYKGNRGRASLIIGRKNEVYVEANMGFTTPEDMMAFKAESIEHRKHRIQRLETLEVPEIIIKIERRRLAENENMITKNNSIYLGLTNYWKKEGGVGARKISFRDHETFIKNLHFYSVAYQGLMEALYQERSLPTPQIPIVISQPRLA